MSRAPEPGCELPGDALHRRRGLQRAGGADPHVHAEQRPGHQQRVRRVVPAVAEVAVAHLGQRLADVIAHGEDVGQHLGGMPVVGEPVPHRHSGVGPQRLHRLLRGPAVFDPVEHPAEHPGGVLHRLLVAELRILRPQVGDMGTLVVRSHLEGRTGPGGGLLEDERDIAASQPADALAHALVHPQFPAQVDQVEELPGGQVGLLEQATSLQVHFFSSGVPLDRASHAARPAAAAAQLVHEVIGVGRGISP